MCDCSMFEASRRIPLRAQHFPQMHTRYWDRPLDTPGCLYSFCAQVNFFPHLSLVGSPVVSNDCCEVLSLSRFTSFLEYEVFFAIQAFQLVCNYQRMALLLEYNRDSCSGPADFH